MAFNFYANTPDSDLIYFGDDPLVWERINAERIRRGLTPLSNPKPGSSSSSNTAAPTSSDAADSLRQAEARRESLIQQITNVDAVKFVNQQTLARKQAELASTSDPRQQALIQSQINELNVVVAQQDQKLAPLQSQLTQTDQQVSAALAAAFPNAPGLPKIPSLPSLPSLNDIAVSLAVGVGAVLKQIPASTNISGLNPAEITGMLAATASTVSSSASASISAVKSVSQTASSYPGTVGSTVASVSTAVGVGEYGITPAQLEAQGYLKPGTVKTFVEPSSNVEQVSTVLSSPTVWTGKDAVTSAEDFAKNTNLQSLTQQNILAQGSAELKNLGSITGAEPAQQLAGAVQNASKYGAQVTSDWIKNQAPADLLQSLNDTAKNAEFAAVQADKIPDLGSITPPPEGAVGTVSRESVDTAVAELLANPKIPLPDYGAAATA